MILLKITLEKSQNIKERGLYEKSWYNNREPKIYESLEIISNTEEDKWYKKNENDVVWWLDNKDAEDKYVFSFDKKTKFNIYKDYSFALTTEQKAIFDRENPKWRDFLKEKR